MLTFDHSMPQSVLESSISIYLLDIIYKEVPDKRPKTVYLGNEPAERVPVTHKRRK